MKLTNMIHGKEIWFLGLIDLKEKILEFILPNDQGN